jgi:hypothetical protein
MSEAASHAMAEATDPMGEGATSGNGRHDAVAETHAVVDDAPLDAHAMAKAVAKAMVEAVVVRVPAIKYGGIAVITVTIPA